MRLTVIAVSLAASLAMFAGCGERPAPPPPAPVKPPSAWTTADTQAVAKELAEGAAREDWVAAFRTRANRPPRVAVLDLQDRTGDHVDVGELAGELGKDLAGTQQVEVVRGRDQADFVIGGSISREPMSGGWRYAVDVRLTTVDGEPVWPGGLEREVKALPVPTAPAQPAQPAR